MRTTKLHRDFGVEVHDIDLRAVTAKDGYPKLRALFESESLLLFRNQHLDDDAHVRFAALFGPLEDRGDFDGFRLSRVSNVETKDRGVRDDARNLLNLKANQLWHTDSTFLPAPALANLFQARVMPAEGGGTEFVSTRAGWRRLDEALKERLRDTVFWHRYSHSRRRIDPDLATEKIFTKWPDIAWRAVWPNPANGEESLYIASHAFAVDGLPLADGAALIDRLIGEMTVEDAVLALRWKAGDVVIWDERATLHRGQSWDYALPRTAVSCCMTATAADGLDRVTPDRAALAGPPEAQAA